MKHAGTMVLAIAVLLVSLAAVFAQSGGGYELTGRAVDSDAQSLSGGGYELSGTIIRRGAVTSGDYSLTGEFPASVETPLSVPCPADLLELSGVGVEDLLQLLYSWGETDSPGDLDGDGTVGILDLLTLLANWGLCP